MACEDKKSAPVNLPKGQAKEEEEELAFKKGKGGRLSRFFFFFSVSFLVKVSAFDGGIAAGCEEEQQ